MKQKTAILDASPDVQDGNSGGKEDHAPQATNAHLVSPVPSSCMC